MSKANAWQELEVAASLARKAAADAQPHIKGWAPGELSWEATALSGDSMMLSTQQPEARVRISKETALRLARWILDTFEDK